ncbi:DUF6420 family protein [Streptomyces sp. NPDC003032]
MKPAKRVTAPSGPQHPCVAYDGLPALRRPETSLPLAHPYEPARPGRFVTPGGGRLTIRLSGRHYAVTLDHLGCAAQTTEPKAAAFKQLALAAEGHCVREGCTHRARFSPGMYRCYQVLHHGIEMSVFVRALLAIEVSAFEPTECLFTTTVAAAGTPR